MHRHPTNRSKTTIPHQAHGSPSDGPKPDPDRTDRCRAIDLAQARSLTNARAFASQTGRPLNGGILTIAWTDCRMFAVEKWASLQTLFFSVLERALKNHGVEPAFVWVRERVTGVGAHTHALVHLGPRPTNIRSPLLAQLSERFGFRDGGLDISFGNHGSHTESMQAGALKYLLKGFDHSAFRYISADGGTENLGAALGIRHRGQQGIIPIKRCGTSQNLGVKARRKAGWREIRDVTALGRSLNPDEATWSTTWMEAA